MAAIELGNVREFKRSFYMYQDASASKLKKAGRNLSNIIFVGFLKYTNIYVVTMVFIHVFLLQGLYRNQSISIP